MVELCEGAKPVPYCEGHIRSFLAEMGTPAFNTSCEPKTLHDGSVPYVYSAIGDVPTNGNTTIGRGHSETHL
jgi:hypothetical protein